MQQKLVNTQSFYHGLKRDPMGYETRAKGATCESLRCATKSKIYAKQPSLHQTEGIISLARREGG